MVGHPGGWGFLGSVFEIFHPLEVTKRMARYRKISVRMWGDKKFRRLTPLAPGGQSLWLYLLTGPHTTSVPGLFMAGEAMLAERLGWPLEDFRKAFREVFREGLFEYDEANHVMSLPNAIKHNPPRSPNVVRSWVKLADEIPECDIKNRHLLAIYVFLKDMGEGFTKAFRDVFGISFEKQDQDQDQDIERDPVQNMSPGGCEKPHTGSLSTPENISHPDMNAGVNVAHGEDPGTFPSLPRADRRVTPAVLSQPPGGPSGFPPFTGESPGGPGGHPKQIHVHDRTTGDPENTPGLATSSAGNSAGNLRGQEKNGDNACPYRVACELPPEDFSNHGHGHHNGADNRARHPGADGHGRSLIPDSRPLSHDLLAIDELLEVYRDAWGLDAPPPRPEHDDRRRVVEALNHPNLSPAFETCKDAIRGHHKLASKEGSQLGKSFRHVFPPTNIGGRTATNRVNSDRVGEFARAGHKLKKKTHKQTRPNTEPKDKTGEFRKWMEREKSERDRKWLEREKGEKEKSCQNQQK